MFKNVASQYWFVFAFDLTDGTPKTGDASNITADLYLDGGVANAVDDTNPTEIAHGFYRFDITQAESNADYILIDPVSGTANIQVVGVPGALFTTAPNSNKLGIESDGDLTKVNTLDGQTPQTADHTANIAAILVDTETTLDGKLDVAQADLDILTGVDGATLATAQANYAPAIAGDEMNLADDSITADKYDESTAFPITEALDISSLVDAISGPGDYAVTITIRTTGGSPVAGVSVWLNTSNVRSGSVAGTKITDSNGQVTFNLEYTTYYVFCHLSGYTFASASFTAASGSVSFTKDIATAISSGSSSFYDDSFLTRAIDDVRLNIDEPTVSAKYSDAEIIKLLEKSYMFVLGEKNRCDQTPAVVKQTVTIVDGVTQYVLPHVMGSFEGLYASGESGTKIFYDGRARLNPYGRGVWLEGHTLNIQSTDMFGISRELIAEWIPNGVARLHNGLCTLNSDGDEVTLGATPNKGTLDTHIQAYAGGVIRILGVDGTTVVGNILQERNITSYNSTTRVATVDVAFDPIPTTDDGYIYYEIAPAIHKGMDTVVSLYAAYRIMSIEGNKKRADGILQAFRNELRNVRLTAYYSNMPEAPRERCDNFDNRRYRR